jgi:hypothetical protein
MLNKHEWLSSGYLQSGNPLTEQSNDATDLATWVCNSANPSYSCRGIRQQEALDRYQDERLNNFPNAGDTDEEVLETYMKLFDDPFFFGGIAKRIELIISGGIDNGLARTSLTAKMNSNGDSELGAKIEVNLPYRSNRNRRLSEIIAVLLHEMCHVIFNIYACKEDNCNRRPEAGGRTGTWASLAVSRVCGRESFGEIAWSVFGGIFSTRGLTHKGVECFRPPHV